jgi:hypothetical protein
MDDILKKLSERAARNAAQAAQAAAAMPAPSPEVLAAHEARRQQQLEMARYRERVGRHLKKLIEDKELKWTQYPPMNQFHRLTVASMADELGLVSHEFGEEEIDRFIIVYKAEFAPSPDEIARLTLRHTHKLADESVERIIAGEPAAPAVEPAPQVVYHFFWLLVVDVFVCNFTLIVLSQRRKTTAADPDAEQDDTIPPAMLHAVGTVKVGLCP